MTLSSDAAELAALAEPDALAELAELAALELAEFPPQAARPNAKTTPRAATTIAASFLFFLIDMMVPFLFEPFPTHSNNAARYYAQFSKTSARRAAIRILAWLLSILQITRIPAPGNPAPQGKAVWNTCWDSFAWAQALPLYDGVVANGFAASKALCVYERPYSAQ